MRISIRVMPRSKKPGIEARPDGTLVVRVSAPSVENRANEAVVEALAGHFGVPRRLVSILRGNTGRNKIVEIGNP